MTMAIDCGGRSRGSRKHGSCDGVVQIGDNLTQVETLILRLCGIGDGKEECRELLPATFTGSPVESPGHTSPHRTGD